MATNLTNFTIPGVIMSTTEYEKHNLEAHVDLCAERYEQLKIELGNVQAGQAAVNLRLDTLEAMISDIAKSLAEKENTALRSIIKISGTLILTLVGTLGGVLWYLIT
jgi:hypothetical protein